MTPRRISAPSGNMLSRNPEQKLNVEPRSTPCIAEAVTLANVRRIARPVDATRTAAPPRRVGSPIEIVVAALCLARGDPNYSTAAVLSVGRSTVVLLAQCERPCRSVRQLARRTRSGRDRLRRHHRVATGCGVQLPDVRGGVQGRCVGRDEQDAHAQPIPCLMSNANRVSVCLRPWQAQPADSRCGVVGDRLTLNVAEA